MTSVSVSALNTYINILTLIKKIEGTKDYFSYNDLMDAARREGLNPEAVEAYLNKLKRIGTVYSPKPGFFRLAD